MIIATPKPVLLALVALAALVALGDAFAPVAHEMRTTKIHFADGGDYELAVFIVDFDEDVYVKDFHNGGALRKFSSLNGTVQMGEDTFPETVGVAKNMVELVFDNYSASKCGPDASVPSAPSGGGHGAPDFLMLTLGSDDPVALFLSTLGGFRLPMPISSKRVAAIFIMNGHESDGQGMIKIKDETDLVACKPKLRFRPDGSGTQTAFNHAGTAYTSSVLFKTVTHAKCDYDKLIRLQDQLVSFLDMMGSLNGDKAIKQVQFMTAAFRALSAWTSCQGLLDSMMTYKDTSVTLEPTKQCTYAYGTADWGLSACCNQTLQYFQCCAPSAPTIKVRTIDSIDSSRVTDMCRHPSIIAGVLREYAQAMSDVQHSKSDAPLNVRDMFDRYTSFFQTCQTLVFETKCQTDAQCTYSGRCDIQSSRCAVDWDNIGELLSHCYVDNIDPDLRLELGSMWNLSATYATDEELQQAFATAFAEQTTSPDCNGPFAQFWDMESGQMVSYRSHVEFSQDANGQWSAVRVPGNETGCLSVKRCNYNPWGISDESMCTGAGLSTDFCGLCFGSQCMEVSRFPKCRVNANDESTCTTVGGTWNVMFGGWGECVDDAKTTLSTCLPSEFCPNAEEDSWECSGALCLITTITSSGDCTDINQWWDSTNSRCVYGAWSQSECEDVAVGGSFFPGRTFSSGVYADQSSCEDGICSIQRVRQEGGSTAECESAHECSIPCHRCMTGSPIPTMCIDTSLTTSEECQAVTGANWNDGLQKCIRGDKQTAADCTGTDLEFASCDQLTKDTCLTATYASALGCFWNDWAECATEDSCTSNGQCDDWEFQRCDQNGCSNGGCVFPSEIDLHGNPKPCSNGKMNSRIGCVDNNIANSSECSTAGGVWHKRATTEAQCNAHGHRCVDPDHPWSMNRYTESQCTACGQEYVPIYTWTVGVWQQGEVLPGSWITRAWDSINTWGDTLDDGKVREAVDTAVARIAGRLLLNKARQEYLPVLDVMEAVVCDCGQDAKAGTRQCFSDSVVVKMVQALCRADPGVPSVCAAVSFNVTNFVNNISASIQAVRIPAYTVIVHSEQSSTSVMTRAEHRRHLTTMASSNTASYLTVPNSQSQYCGQVVGSAQGFESDTPIVGKVLICLDVNTAIDQDIKAMPVRDFAKAKSNGLPGIPLQVTVTVKGLQFCAKVSEEGLYYPILRTKDLSAAKLTNSNSDDESAAAASGLSLMAMLCLALMMSFLIVA